MESPPTIVVGADSDRWSSIQRDILLSIAGKIVSIDDYVRFTATCRSWYLLATDSYNKFSQELNLSPLFYSGSSERVALENPISGSTLVLDPVRSQFCWGSPFGWLITYQLYGLGFSLLNPFTGSTIYLPSLFVSISDVKKMKPFLTGNPKSDPENCIFLVLSSSACMLSFLRPGKGETSWSLVEGIFDFDDITYFKGKLYGIQSSNTDHLVKLISFQFDYDHGQNDRLVLCFAPVISFDPTPHHPCLISLHEKHLVDMYI